MEQGEGLELNRLEFDCGVFYGEVYDGKASGLGIWTGNFTGHRYEGEFLENKRHGLGEYSCADGAKYIGNWINDSIDGQGLYWLADGLRCIDGDWTDGSPLHGTAVEADGTFYCIVNTNKETTLGEMDAIFEGKVGWEMSGRFELWPGPGREADLGTTAEWTGTAALANGTRFEGRMKGLRPLEGVVTDVAGTRFTSTFSGAKTLGEKLTPLTEKVMIYDRPKNRRVEVAMDQGGLTCAEANVITPPRIHIRLDNWVEL
jgi:hypothetical protein